MQVKPRVLVLLSEEGRIVERKVIETSRVAEVAKEVAARALGRWDPSSSDFTVIRSELELRYKLPISPDLYDVLAELNLPREVEGGELVVKVPVYTISFDNAWMADSYYDRRMYVVALVFDEEGLRQVEDYAREATRGPKRVGSGLELDEEALRRLEEGLREAEAGGRRRRGRGG